MIIVMYLCESSYLIRKTNNITHINNENVPCYCTVIYHYLLLLTVLPCVVPMYVTHVGTPWWRKRWHQSSTPSCSAAVRSYLIRWVSSSEFVSTQSKVWIKWERRTESAEQSRAEQWRGISLVNTHTAANTMQWDTIPPSSFLLSRYLLLISSS